MTRLDVWLAEHGLAESREKAQALVMAGRVKIDGARASKPGTRVRDASAVVVDPGRAHVGRGALKLAGALDAFGIDPAGRVAVDVAPRPAGSRRRCSRAGPPASTRWTWAAASSTSGCGRIRG